MPYYAYIVLVQQERFPLERDGGSSAHVTTGEPSYTFWATAGVSPPKVAIFYYCCMRSSTTAHSIQISPQTVSLDDIFHQVYIILCDMNTVIQYTV